MDDTQNPMPASEPTTDAPAPEAPAMPETPAAPAAPEGGEGAM